MTYLSTLHADYSNFLTQIDQPQQDHFNLRKIIRDRITVKSCNEIQCRSYGCVKTVCFTNRSVSFTKHQRLYRDPK